MTFYRAIASTLVVLPVLLLVACGTDCMSSCERVEKADCFGDPIDLHDCEYECKHTQDLVMNAECSTEYDQVLVCLDDLEDVCESFEDCDADGDCNDPKCDNELDDLQDCITDYCAEHPRNNECETGVVRGGTVTPEPGT